MVKGYLALVLHAHLPFVRQMEHERFLQEKWLYEAISDTYIPLLKMFGELEREGVDFRLTISLSPTLIEMMNDELLRERYLKDLEMLITLAEEEFARTRHDARLNELARMYLARYIEARRFFEKECGCDLVREFGRFAEKGFLELITCSATHAYLPFAQVEPAAVKAQIRVGIETFTEAFGMPPKGFWLPECAYYPGHERYLAEAGIKYFFVESHGILGGSPPPAYGLYSAYTCDGGVAVFGRDIESSRAVWSAKEGYPGDPHYREYYRDIGYDLDYDYIRPYIGECGSRINTGIKYHRITGPAEQKDLYDRAGALARASVHADDFVAKRVSQLQDAPVAEGRRPIVVSPYDAELFGHWWFEGPEWLGYTLRKVHQRRDVLRTVTPGEYLGMYPGWPHIRPTQSSWGYKGYHEFWLDSSNDWIYRHLHKAARMMAEAARGNRDATGKRRRILNQMARELLLSQASDWAFMMKTGTFSGYAADKTREHVSNFHRLHEQLSSGNIDLPGLEELEVTNNVFEGINYEVYAD